MYAQRVGKIGSVEQLLKEMNISLAQIKLY